MFNCLNTPHNMKIETSAYTLVECSSWLLVGEKRSIVLCIMCVCLLLFYARHALGKLGW